MTQVAKKQEYEGKINKARQDLNSKIEAVVNSRQKKENAFSAQKEQNRNEL